MNTQNNQSLLSSKAVLIRLFTSCFTGNPYDKVLTREVESSHGTDANRVSVRKKIMQGKELNAVLAGFQELRKTSEKLSAPWLDGGLRIVAGKSLVAAKVEIEAKIREVMERVDTFLDAYEDILARDRVALNGTFRESDYPSRAGLRSKFAARLEVFPIPADFRVEGIDAAVKDELTREMNKLTAKRVADAKHDLLARIREKVAALASRIGHLTEGSRFHDSTVINIAQACAEVRAANFDGDVTLDRLANTVEKTFAAISPDTIRASKAAREETERIAKATLDELDKAVDAMAGFVA